MRKTVLTIVVALALSACAIEGVGFDGRINAYHNAAADGRQFAALHRGTHDAAWYAGWCAAIEPHFQRMVDVHARVARYCDAMQAQPDQAEAIRQDLVTTLNDTKATTVSNRNATLSALAVSAQIQQAQAATAARQPAPSIHCTSQRDFNQVTTDCQ